MEIKNKFSVVTRFMRERHHFDTEEEALVFFDAFIGDAFVSNNGIIIHTKQYVNTFSDLIHSALCFSCGKYIDYPNEEVMQVYNDLLPMFKESGKGVGLTGDYGVGKTTIMKVFSLCINSGYIADAKPFRVIKVKDVAREFLDKGFDAFDIYRIGQAYKSNVCLDDVGVEFENVKVYGTNVSVFPEILMEVYDTFIDHHTVTHFTTNLLPEEIEKRYGLRVHDRLIEMTNVYAVQGQSKRY